MANGRVVGATVAAMLLAVASRAPAMPADFVYKVVMDTDNNPATGCSFVVQDANIPSQSMNGFEHALEIFVATAFTPPKVVGVQLLQCLVSDAPGGDTLLVDGFNAASILRKEDPAAFDLLTRVPVNFRFSSGDADLQARQTLISVDEDGDIVGVHFNNRSLP